MNFRKVFIIVLFFALFGLGFCFADYDNYEMYAFEQLKEKEQEVYQKISNAVLNCEPVVVDVLVGAEANMKVLSAFMDDNPGFFWVESKLRYSLFVDEDGNVRNSIHLYYTHQEDLSFDVERFVDLVSKFHQYIKDDENDWIKLYHIYDYLAKSIKYDNNYMDQSMWSVFFEGIGVCAGFARSFQYLARQEGIPCLMVHGYERDSFGNIGTVGHVWVMAKINDTWYQFDPTWGLADANGNVDFSFFCRSDARMGMTHIIRNNYPLPGCPSDDFSYAQMRKRYMKVYDESHVVPIIQNAFSRNELTFTLEFENATELEKARQSLLMEKKVFSLFKQAGFSVSNVLYATNKQNYSLKISVSKFERL